MTDAKHNVVVIDDELQIRRFLRVALESHGFAVHETQNGAEGLREVIAKRPDLVILDLGLPDMDGADVLRRLREWYDKPIIILSVRDDENSIVTALDNGADDYLTKPFKLAELIARIHVALRHTRSSDVEPISRHQDVEINLVARRVFVRGVEVRLTATEYDLLRVFAKNAGRVLTHAQILKEVWGPNSSEHKQYLRVYVGHLRHKIEADPNQPTLLITEPGVGYRFGS